MNQTPRPQFHWPTHANLVATPILLVSGEASRKDRIWAIISYVFFPIPMPFVSKDNEFVWFHIRQSFGTFLASVGIYIINFVLGLYLLAIVLNVALIGIWIVGITNVIQGNKKPLPIIGNFSEKYRIF